MMSGSLCLFWCPYMVMNVSVQYNGGFLPEIILLYGHTYSKKSSMDQPGKVANPARGQLIRENEYFPIRVRA